MQNDIEQLPSTAISQEAQKLHNVSSRLDSLADQYPLISEALLVISGVRNTSGSVRNTATLLEVLVVAKIGSPFDPRLSNA